MNDPQYLPRRPHSLPAEIDEQASAPFRRDRPSPQVGEDLNEVYPRRAKPTGDATAPPRRLPPDTEGDLPPRRPAPAPDPADLPPRRPGSAAARPAEDADVDLPPRRGLAVPEPTEDLPLTVPPQRGQTGPSSTAAAPAPSAAATDVLEAGKTSESATIATLFTSSSAAKEIEEILQMLENHIIEADVSAPDLHMLTGLIFGLGKHVSRLAIEKDQAGARSVASAKADEEPEPED